ncbi:helix-turn-helix domain-containing protein [Anianabacter salinae]|uniref:helix-turn-helix domain-containing protein n=1 Tax=Anianabacter salinae TaxID=2851023 RepID=UPI00225E11B2|nr:AraC family transcriptional regulator [Anianabacter salinae]
MIPLPRLAFGGRWRTEAMRSYRQPMLLWFTRGQGRIIVSGVTRGYGPHHAFFMPPGTMHGFEMSGQVFGTAVYFPRSADLSLPQEPVHFKFRETQAQGELTQHIDALSRELEHDAPAKDRALMYQGGLLSVWLERELIKTRDVDMETDASRRLAAAYSALVEAHYRSGKTINDYAAELGVTPTHLSRACNTSCGRPASAILADRIHYEARRLLVESKRPVKDIASELGFTSAAYFTRAFQKYTGLTPSAFREHG